MPSLQTYDAHEQATPRSEDESLSVDKADSDVLPVRAEGRCISGISGGLRRCGQVYEVRLPGFRHVLFAFVEE